MIKNQSKLINGISFFQDSEDPSVYYYSPPSPRLAIKTIADEQVPQINLYAYRGVNNNGGYLTLETDLQVSQEVLDVAKTQLSGATFLPFPLVDGDATMNVIGHSQQQNISLMGDNTAIFNQSLDQQQSEFLAGALKYPCSVPLAVVYNLDFVAMRPASKYNLEAQWDEVQTYLRKTYSIGFFFLSATISKISETLISNKTVKITGTVNNETMTEATTQLTSMLLSTFFKPVFEPIAQGQKESTAPLFGFRFEQVDIKQLDRRYLSFNMQENSVVRLKKQISGTIAAMGCEQIIADQCIKYIDLSSPFFMNRKLSVGSGIDFAKNQINYIVVTCQYGNSGDARKQLILNAETPILQFSWPSIIQDNTMQRQVTYRYDIYFEQSVTELQNRPDKITSDKLSTDWDYMQIIPAQYYSLFPLSVLSLASLQWLWYKRIELVVKYYYVVNKQQYNVIKNIKLTAEKNHLNWGMFIPTGQASDFDYCLYYMVTEGLPHNPLKTVWQPGNDRVLVTNAYSHQRTAYLLPEYQWDKLSDVKNIKVTVSYKYNGADSNALQQIFTFDKDNTEQQTFSADQQDLNYQTVTYFQTINFVNGNSKLITPRQTDGKYIPLYYPEAQQ